MKITALNPRMLAISLAAALFAPALMAQNLQVIANTTPVTQVSPYKSLSFRLSTSYTQLAFVEATLNFDSARFSVYSITNYMPHECRLVGNKITLTGKGPNFGSFPMQSSVDFCQVWLKLKVGAAVGSSLANFSPTYFYDIYGNNVSGWTTPATITIQ